MALFQGVKFYNASMHKLLFWTHPSVLAEASISVGWNRGFSQYAEISSFQDKSSTINTWLFPQSIYWVWTSNCFSFSSYENIPNCCRFSLSCSSAQITSNEDSSSPCTRSLIMMKMIEHRRELVFLLNCMQVVIIWGTVMSAQSRRWNFLFVELIKSQSLRWVMDC